MSNLILSLEVLFGDLFKDVSKSLSGTYKNNDEEIQQLINELHNEEIPSARNDRTNLKNDGSNVVRDYKKAFELKKVEF
ncbi:MAG: hypothetical protein B7Y83_17395 [Flavobacteriales bacterium 32-34-25]|nr:MAG: hypothetical protein B7Y83_17395 [Flavobacteriales bacterium 32-34-25]